jgi:hypothetical protein
LITRSRISNTIRGHIKNSKNSLNISGISKIGCSNPNEGYSNANNPIKNKSESASIIKSKILEFIPSRQHKCSIKFSKKYQITSIIYGKILFIIVGPTQISWQRHSAYQIRTKYDN